MGGTKKSRNRKRTGGSRKKRAYGSKIKKFVGGLIGKISAHSIANTFLKGLVISAIWFVVIGAAALAYFAYDLPKIDNVVEFRRRPIITILANDGSLIARYGDFQAAMPKAEDLPVSLVNAVIATEDRRFYSHFGIDIFGLIRASIANARAGRTVQGGSTITQQLAKNLFLSSERTVRRKMQEALLAIQLERRFTKSQILTAYLNYTYFGSGAYGVDAASRVYFGKPVQKLNLYESATLAGLLKAPARYMPTTGGMKTARNRTAIVLKSMVKAGYLGESDIKELLDNPPAIAARPLMKDGVGYFADWVADQAAELSGNGAKDITIYTTLDRQLQSTAERLAGDAIKRDGEPYQVSQVAMLALSRDGAIRAMVGGKSYTESQFNRTTQALRQPGSAFKPLIFLAGLTAGLSGNSKVTDAPIVIDGWKPANFENVYRGEMTLRDALTYSANSATIRILNQVGAERVKALAKEFGIESKLRSGPSLALGTSEVTMLELAGLYTSLANMGIPTPPYAIKEIRDSSGKTIYRRRPANGSRAVPYAKASELVEMMEAVLERGTGKEAKIDGLVAAGKTGTTQNYRDAWFMGFTDKIVAGVWMGNDDNKAMRKVTGGSLPARLWKALILASRGEESVDDMVMAVQKSGVRSQKSE